MNRRGFMGLFGAAAVAGPKAAAKVTADMASLDVTGVGLLGSLIDPERNNYGVPPVDGKNYRLEWAKQQLARLAKETIFDMRRKENSHYVNRLDANTHALKSVSLVFKMKMSQKKQFMLERQEEIEMYKRIIAGLDD